MRDAPAMLRNMHTAHVTCSGVVRHLRPQQQQQAPLVEVESPQDSEEALSLQSPHGDRNVTVETHAPMVEGGIPLNCSSCAPCKAEEVREEAEEESMVARLYKQHLHSMLQNPESKRKYLVALPTHGGGGNKVRHLLGAIKLAIGTERILLVDLPFLPKYFEKPVHPWLKSDVDLRGKSSQKVCALQQRLSLCCVYPLSTLSQCTLPFSHPLRLKRTCGDLDCPSTTI